MWISRKCYGWNMWEKVKNILERERGEWDRMFMFLDVKLWRGETLFIG